jgi:HSP20 family protein
MAQAQSNQPQSNQSQSQSRQMQGGQAQGSRSQSNRMQRRGQRNWFQDESSGRPLSQRNMPSRNIPAYPASYFGPLSTFFWDLDRMFDNTFRSLGLPAMVPGMSNWDMQLFTPNIDITSSNDEYVITVEVPGVEEENIRLDISADGTLTISGEKQQEINENLGDVQFAERAFGSFQRTLELPEDVDTDNIEARFKNGVLTIVCPRTGTLRSQHRQIPIGRDRGGMEGGRTASNENKRGASGQGQEQRRMA